MVWQHSMMFGFVGQGVGEGGLRNISAPLCELFQVQKPRATVALELLTAISSILLPAARGSRASSTRQV